MQQLGEAASAEGDAAARAALLQGAIHQLEEREEEAVRQKEAKKQEAEAALKVGSKQNLVATVRQPLHAALCCYLAADCVRSICFCALMCAESGQGRSCQEYASVWLTVLSLPN
jgi:hypothetical protein